LARRGGGRGEAEAMGGSSGLRDDVLLLLFELEFILEVLFGADNVIK
jgi:hypothetical protein